MGSLDGLVAQIQGLSGSNSDLNSLLTALKQSENLIRHNQAGILIAVASLDLDQHSLGSLFLLESKGRSSVAQGDQEFLDCACRFLQACSPNQVRMVPEKFTSLCRLVRTHAVQLQRPKQPVLALREAVGKLCPSPDYLSPIHSDLFQLCLLSKCYNAAAPVLDADVYSVDPAKTACTATDVLLYCYYGAMLEIGRRRYPRALHLLLTAITTPTMVISAITVACMKKHILVSLLHLGSAPPLPKLTPPIVARAQKSECASYLELAKLCGGDGGAAQLSEFAATKRQEFDQDGNWGLVSLVVEAATRRRALRLTGTYVTLPLDTVAQRVGLAGGAAEAEVTLLRLVHGGDVCARISEQEGMVEFVEEEESFDTAEVAARVDGLIQGSMDLADRKSVV